MRERAFTVYALRRRGSSQIRYVGQTNLAPEDRLASHIALAEKKPLYPVHSWLLAVGGNAEVVEISRHATRAAAIAAERNAIEAYVEAGHRLCNVRGNPNVPERLWRNASAASEFLAIAA